MTYDKALSKRSEEWFKATQEATTQAEWDAAFDLYAEDVLEIQNDFGHPANPPKKRPL